MQRRYQKKKRKPHLIVARAKRWFYKAQQPQQQLPVALQRRDSF
jgi:hypothetical protein